MKLNLKFYKGKDEYSDGDIEDKIIEFIKKYPYNYEEAFKEDFSWPVFYHLSDIRKNVIRWYPFKNNSSILEVGGGMGALTEELCQKCKSVTSIELSKRRATAILERNKKANNLEIIVGNFQDIKLKKKYDYILLNGVLEYGASYIDSDNPYEEFINKLKENLNTAGKILVAIENRFGLKYWCGANEDHTSIPFDGINGYQNSKNIKTFSKKELEDLAKKCGLKANFYYMFPDYKFPKIIFNDEALKKEVYSNYTPYYYTKMNMLIDEKKVFKNIYENNEISFFANSFFVELSLEKDQNIIEFVKFNNEYRKEEYNLYTYLANDRFYKKALNKKSKGKIKDILQIEKLINSYKINTAKIIEQGDEIYSEKIDGENLNKKLKQYFQKHDTDEIIKTFESIYEIIKSCAGRIINYKEKNIYDKYKIKMEENELKKLHFYEHGIIDIVPENIIVKNKKYTLVDQEWYEKNTPVEYILYRAIVNFIVTIEDDGNLLN